MSSFRQIYFEKNIYEIRCFAALCQCRRTSGKKRLVDQMLRC